MRFALKPIDQQTIVITGASSGIGLATARRAAELGAQVVLAARNAGALEAAVVDIQRRGGTAMAVPTDVSRKTDIEGLAQTTIEAFGGFDTWVNNAGGGVYGRLHEVSDDDHRQLFETNFWGLVHGSLAAKAHLRTKGGAIVNLGSVASDLAFPIQGMYCASKHAIKGFTDALRMEIDEANEPISVTLIKPAAINTPFPQHARNYLAEEPSLPPPVYQPEDVANAIVHAAVHGGRDFYIGGGGKLMTSVNKRLPSLMDLFGASALAIRQQTTGAPPVRPREGALHAPTTGGTVHGQSAHLVRSSMYTRATMHPVLAGALLAAAMVGSAALLGRRST